MSDNDKPQEWTQLETELFTALGEAAIQWKPQPSGVFDSNGCNRIGRELWKKVNAALAAIRLSCVSELDNAYAKGAQEQRRLDEKELAAEREIIKEWFDKWGKEKLLREKLEQQLLQTQTAIEQHNKSILHEDRLKDIKVDLSLLAEHDKEVARPFIDTLNKRAAEEARMLEEVCKPLVGEALESIAANTCCDKCQEAALVAKSALAKFEGKNLR